MKEINGTSKAEFDILSKEADEVPFHCIVCIIQNNADTFSLGYLYYPDLKC